MDIEKEAINIMVKEIKKLIKEMITIEPFDRTKKGRIVNHIEGKFYNVQIGNETYKAISPFFTCEENDIVYIKIVENNYNNLIIECPIK